MNPVDDLSRFLKRLHAQAGAPSRREMAQQTGYGKSTIGDAFAGQRLPTWPVVQAMVAVTGGDEDEARDLWVAAKGGTHQAQQAPEWLTSVRTDPRRLITGLSFTDACATAATNPKKALDSSWEVLRLTGGQLSHVLYDAIPGHWSSDLVATFRRAEEDGHLPAGAAKVADTVHYHYVESNVHPQVPPAISDVLQIVPLAYRLAWQASDIVVAMSSSRGK
ncbi:helix-turn-helix transcriptional regulator (plasmid) [Streptomyces sp. NBC_00841]|uniref:helix-turn-helix domain-containing protein n=1 Tax=Streptomyces sp. NBC_00841 TaxID=2975847 RepID=UPI002DDAE49D|nr:helix-turn-helix transcriptional regulator [Streptomyces sp. NBC_00841]WSA06012.1 helix-turn-helix transcriptional regulator [Streptomyces sp. NBC_00841]